MLVNSTWFAYSYTAKYLSMEISSDAPSQGTCLRTQYRERARNERQKEAQQPAGFKSMTFCSTDVALPLCYIQMIKYPIMLNVHEQKY